MDKNVKEKKYELVLILDAKISQEEKDQILSSVNDFVTKGGGKTINSQVWLEKQKFAFEINKKTEGTYYLVNIECTPASVSKIKLDLRLNEKVLRFLVIQKDASQPAESLKS